MKDELLSPISILIITHSFVRASLYQSALNIRCVSHALLGAEDDKTHPDHAHGLTGERVSTVPAWCGWGAGYKHSGHKGGCLAHTVVTEGGRADIIEVVPKEASPRLELGVKRIKPGRSIPGYKVLNWLDMSVHVCK